jgi:hypothetical protein
VSFVFIRGSKSSRHPTASHGVPQFLAFSAFFADVYSSLETRNPKKKALWLRRCRFKFSVDSLCSPWLRVKSFLPPQPLTAQLWRGFPTTPLFRPMVSSSFLLYPHPPHSPFPVSRSAFPRYTPRSTWPSPPGTPKKSFAPCPPTTYNASPLKTPPIHAHFGAE